MNVVEVKAAALHLVRQPLRLLTRVDKDSRLLDAQVVVEVTQRVQLVVLTRDLHKPLLDTLQAHLLRLQQNLHRIAENALRHLYNVWRHRCRKECHLRRCRPAEAQNAVNLLPKTCLQHLVRLIQHQHLDGVRRQDLAVEQVVEASRRHQKHVRDVRWLHLGLRDDVNVGIDRRTARRRVRANAEVRADALRDRRRLLRQLARRRNNHHLNLVLGVVNAADAANDERAGLTGT